ncbi:hypothetical protein BS47DRAFT_426069 [Hydnum rufescens UP504]|uniref:Uncharacterized protein n=1 Tax=Hydnum rufescens UP504 TaxID=1448309 RepID=A0A9P6B6U0_9AGAM|nr:hypothetical protein BS47DRAFT_426069 [Hydnum rufescens UP504]
MANNNTPHPPQKKKPPINYHSVPNWCRRSRLLFPLFVFLILVSRSGGSTNDLLPFLPFFFLP